MKSVKINYLKKRERIKFFWTFLRDTAFNVSQNFWLFNSFFLRFFLTFFISLFKTVPITRTLVMHRINTAAMYLDSVFVPLLTVLSTPARMASNAKMEQAVQTLIVQTVNHQHQMAARPIRRANVATKTHVLPGLPALLVPASAVIKNVQMDSFV